MVTDLPSRRAALAYVTPSHQYPTGRTLAAPRRERLIAWARHSGCYLIEDDYDGDFRYEGSPLPAIAAGAPDCTIYLGTFSTSLGAGLAARLHGGAAPARRCDPFAPKPSSTAAIPGSSRRRSREMIRSGSYRRTPLPDPAAIPREPRLPAGGPASSFRSRRGQRPGRRVASVLALPPGFPDAAIVEALAAQGPGRRLCAGECRRPRCIRQRIVARRVWSSAMGR